MMIDPRAIGFELTDALRAHVNLRLRNELRHFVPGVLRVTVRLDDVNGDHGGIDKRCGIVATLRRRRLVVAQAVHKDLYAAIDLAAASIRRSIRRALTRHIGRERNTPQRPGALWQANERYHARPRAGAAQIWAN